MVEPSIRAGQTRHMAPRALVRALAWCSALTIVIAIVSTASPASWALGESRAVILADGELRGAWLHETPSSASDTTTDWRLPSVFEFVSASNVFHSKGVFVPLFPDKPFRQTLTLNPSTATSRYRLSFVSIHLWGVAVLLGVLPCYALVHGFLRRRYRRRHGRCVTCGYDLTGNTSGICPECATEIPSGHEEHIAD